jgi:hypothetical protein
MTSEERAQLKEEIKVEIYRELEEIFDQVVVAQGRDKQGHFGPDLQGTLRRLARKCEAKTPKP